MSGHLKNKCVKNSPSRVICSDHPLLINTHLGRVFYPVRELNEIGSVQNDWT